MLGSFFSDLNGQKNTSSEKNGAGSMKNEGLSLRAKRGNLGSRHQASFFLILASIFKLIRLKILELRYFPHLEIRLVHDKAYANGGTYKRYSDNPNTAKVHKVSAYTFMFSFIIFTLAQALFPIFNLGQPSPAQAGSHSVTWNQKGHFTGDSFPTGAATTSLESTNLEISDSSIGDEAAVTLSPFTINAGTGAQGDVIISSTVNIENLIANYNPDTDVVPNFRNLTITSTGVLTTDNLKQLKFKVSEVLTIQTGGSINVSGRGYGSATGPGKGANGGGGGGAGYGGVGGTGGGDGVDGAGGLAYTSFPDFGSGGGNADSWIPGGAGGGSVYIIANQVQLSGQILANGLSGWADDTISGGGGSGGSVYLSTLGSVTNASNIRARGGNGGGSYYSGGGGGAGGRVKLEAASITGAASVTGGIGGYDDFSKVGTDGQAGVYEGAIADTYFNHGQIKNFQANLSGGIKPDWKSIEWTGDTPANTEISFRVKGADTQSGLATASWSPYFTNFSGVINMSSLWLEVELNLSSSDGIYTPSLNSFQVNYDSLESPTITPKKTDDSFLNEHAGSLWTNESSVKVEAAEITCEGCGTSDGRYIEAEVSTDGNDFTNPITATGSVQSGGSPSTATISGLSAGNTYHLRARSLDAQGRASGWSVYPNTIKMEQAPPTGTVSINSGANYATSTNVTLTLSASDTGGSSPTKTDLKYRLSNNGESWTEWTSYPANDTVSNWDLTQYGGNADDGTKNVYVQYRDNAGNVSGTWVQTSDGDFNGGTKASVAVEDNSVKLSPVDNTGWIDGRSGTVMEGKQVYSQLVSDGAWKTSNTNCVEPQCVTGADPAFPSNRALVVDNSVDFSEYPARNACKNIGGRLSYNDEFLELFAGRAHYGFNMDEISYWIATESSAMLAYYYYNDSDSWPSLLSTNKANNRGSNICVRDLEGGFSKNGTFTSQVRDLTNSNTTLGQTNFTVDTPANTSITLEARAGDDTSEPADGVVNVWTDWQTLTSGQTASNELSNHRYLQYRVTLTSTDGMNTPTLHDISFESANIVASITLDTQKPTDVGNLRSVEGYNQNTWNTNSSPTFVWDASTDTGTGVKGYKYCFGTNATCTPETNLGNITQFQVPTITQDGNYRFRIVAEDNAGNLSANVATFVYGYDTAQAPTPSGLSASDNNNDDIYISWNSYSDSGAPVANYQLERVTKKDYDDFGLNADQLSWAKNAYLIDVPSYAEITCGSGNSYTEYKAGHANQGPSGNNCGITAGEGGPVIESVAHYFRIRVRDAAHLDSWSGWFPATEGSLVMGMTLDTTPPTSPSNVQVNPTGDFQTTLTWDPSVDNGSGVGRYEVFRYRTNSDYLDTSVSDNYEMIGFVEYRPLPYDSRTWVDNDQKNIEFDSQIKLVASTTLIDSAYYHYRVRAVDKAGNKSKVLPDPHPINDPFGIRNRGSAQVNDSTPPTISQISSATTSDITEIDVNWEPWADVSDRDNSVIGSGVANYEVWRRTDVAWYLVPDADGNNSNNQFIDRNHDGYDLYAEFSTLSGSMTPENPVNGGNINLADASLYPTSGRLLIDNEYIDYSSKDGNTLQGISRSVIGSTSAEHLEASPVYIIDRFQSLTTYYYKLRATDNTGNTSGFTTEDPNYEGAKTRTPDATAPSVPRNVNVTSYKEAPNLNGAEDDESNNYKIENYGRMMTIAWNGSQDNSKVLGYELYRSETTPAGLSAAAWLASATKLVTVNLSGATSSDERSVSYTYIDNNQTNAQTSPLVQKIGGAATVSTTKAVTPNLVDAKVYYYRVMAFDDAEPEVLYSSLSAPSTPTTRASDYAPDSTPPATPDEVKINPIWGVSENDFRFVITWKRIEDSLRNGQPDFRSYRLYRSTDGNIFEMVTINGQNPLLKEDRNVSIEQNYYVDSDVTQNMTYYYYVTSVDDAGTSFRYPDPPYTGAPIVSEHNNESVKSVTVSQNPKEVAPEIVNLNDSGLKAQVLATGVSTATVYWETNQPTESLVEYRKKGTNDPFFGTYNSSMVSEHTLVIKGLEAATEYEYRVSGKNIVGFDKKAGAGTTDNNVQPLATRNFRITDVNVTQTTTESATIEWKTTDLESDSSVQFLECVSADPNSCRTSRGAFNTDMVKNHTVVLENLRPATIYIYKVRSTTADGNVAEIGNFLRFETKSFDTAQFTISPSASDIAQENITATSAKIVWNTAVATDTWVDYGTRPGAYNQSAGDDKYNTVHVVDLRNLTPGTTYYYRVRGKDANNIQYISREYSFTAVLQPEIRNLRFNLTSSYTAEISFDTNVDTEASVTFGKDTNLDLKAGSADLKRNHLIKLENLEDASSYRYFVEVRDSLNNVKRSETQPFSTPIDKSGPRVLNLKIDILPMSEADETASVIISWNTDKPSTTKVEYDEGMIGPKLAKSTIEDESLNTSHTVIIKELSPSTTYRFKMAGKDRRENPTDSNEYTFVTPAQEKSIFQLIVRSLEETFAWTKNLGSFFSNLRQKVR